MMIITVIVWLTIARIIIFFHFVTKDYCKQFGHMVKNCSKPSSKNIQAKYKGKSNPKPNIATGAS
jgi:hypothetical protein